MKFGRCYLDRSSAKDENGAIFIKFFDTSDTIIMPGFECRVYTWWLEVVESFHSFKLWSKNRENWLHIFSEVDTIGFAATNLSGRGSWEHKAEHRERCEAAAGYEEQSRSQFSWSVVDNWF